MLSPTTYLQTVWTYIHEISPNNGMKPGRMAANWPPLFLRRDRRDRRDPDRCWKVQHTQPDADGMDMLIIPT